MRQILTLLVSASLFLSTPVPLFALPEGGPIFTPADFSREFTDAENYARQYADLEAAAEGQPKSALAPDRFLLMEQSVFPKEVPVIRTFAGNVFRNWRLTALLNKTARYIVSLELGRTNTEPNPEKLADAQIRSAILDEIKDGRRSDTPLFIWDRKGDLEQLEQIYRVLNEVKQDWNQRSLARHWNPTEAPYERIVRAVNWWNVSVQIQDGDEVARTLKMSDTVSGVNPNADQPYSCETNDCRFNLVLDKTVLHVFGVPSRVIATYDSFVVFTHPDSYSPSTGTQYLSFLDLSAYNGLIGNEEIPVFRLPLKIDEPVQTMTVQDGHLILNGKYKVERRYFEKASDMQQIAFNLQANLVNPDSWEKVLPLVDTVQEYFKKVVGDELQSRTDEREGLRDAQVLLSQLARDMTSTLDAQKLMKPKTEQEHKELSQKITANGSEKNVQERLELYHRRLSQSALLAKIMRQTQERTRDSRELMARVQLLARALVSPCPNASQKIKEALGIWYMNSKDSVAGSALDRVLKLADRPFVTGGVVAAAILAATAPDTFHTMVTTGLSFSTAISDYVTGAFTGIAGAAAKGTHRTFTFFNPSSLYNQYVKDGNWWRTGVGLGVYMTFLGALYFVPHFYFNLVQLYKDLKKPGIDGFVDRQNKFKAAYYARLASDEGSRRQFGADVKFEPDEEAKIQAWLADKRSEVADRGIFKRLKRWAWRNTTDAALETQNASLEKVVEAADQSPQTQAAVTQPVEEFQSFWTAAKHFAFSMPALELTLENWARIWNGWASWRFTTIGFGYARVLGSDLPLYITFKPVSFATRLLYPDFLSTALFKRPKRAVVPTEMNGGLRSRCRKLYQKACSWMGVNSAEGVNTRQGLAALQKFEDQIIAVEDQITEVAFQKALEGLPKFMQDKEDMRNLFTSTSLNSITQKDITNLTWASKTFLRAQFESIYQSAMNRFMSQVLNQAEAGEAEEAGEELPVVSPPLIEGDYDPAQALQQQTLKAMKRRLVSMHVPDGQKADYTFDLERAKAIALQVADSPEHFRNAERAVARGRLSPSNFAMNSKYQLMTDLDPQNNRSMERVAVVNKRLESPGALGRALRYEISKLKRTLPIDIVMKLLLSAGIFEGAMKPIQDSFWGPNSTAYLSHTSFYMITASSFFMGIMADAWVKLQQDARQDEMGEFGAIPRGEDALRSFFGWYRKQFAASQNSVMKNWGFANYVAFWNLPAALTNISLFYFMFSGRIDLSLLLSGYVITFGTPLNALHYKVDQAFERAAHFAARGIEDEKWLAHPEVQAFLVPEMQRLRDNFTILNDIYGNIQGTWTQNIQMIPTDLGTRGFQRALFGGGLLEEYIVNYALNPAISAVSGIPVLSTIATPLLKACAALLTHGNTDLRLGK